MEGVVDGALDKSGSAYAEIANRIFGFLTTEAVSSAFTLTTVRAMPKFLLVFTILINDLLFYKYHRKFGPEYPASAKTIMERFDLMKEIGMNSFSSYLPFFSNENIAFALNN